MSVSSVSSRRKILGLILDRAIDGQISCFSIISDMNSSVDLKLESHTERLPVKSAAVGALILLGKLPAGQRREL